MTGMETIRIFVVDYIRLMSGRPLLGFGPDRSSDEADARATVKRFSRGSVAMQDDRFVSEQDSEYERNEVAKLIIRN